MNYSHHPPHTSRLLPGKPQPASARVARWVRRVTLCVMIGIGLLCFRGGPSRVPGMIVRTHSSLGVIPTPIPTTGPITYGEPPLVIPMDTTAADRNGFEDWCEIISATFPQGSIVVMGHGNDAFPGVWAIFPTADEPPFEVHPFAGCPLPLQWLCDCLRHEYPDTPIVLLCCNPKHEHVYGTNIWYAMDSVFITPDSCESSVANLARHTLYPGVIGNIDAFVESRPRPRPTTKP